jgi:hypothetical protein
VSFDIVTRARELGIDVDSHRCTCEPCLHTSALCPASVSSLMLEIQEAEAPHVCPGCYAVGEEPCAGYCPDAAIERAREASESDDCSLCDHQNGIGPCFGDLEDCEEA